MVSVLSARAESSEHRETGAVHWTQSSNTSRAFSSAATSRSTSVRSL